MSQRFPGVRVAMKKELRYLLRLERKEGSETWRACSLKKQELKTKALSQ